MVNLREGISSFSVLIHINILSFQLDSHKDLKSYRSLDTKLHSISKQVRELEEEEEKGWGGREGMPTAAFGPSPSLCAVR